MEYADLSVEDKELFDTAQKIIDEAYKQGLSVSQFSATELYEQAIGITKSVKKQNLKKLRKEAEEALDCMVKVRTLISTWFWLPWGKEIGGTYILIGLDYSPKGKVARKIMEAREAQPSSATTSIDVSELFEVAGLTALAKKDPQKAHEELAVILDGLTFKDGMNETTI